MLVKCPKCGFDQPDDNYCANCGIEMGSFKPTKAPLWSTIVKSPLFSLAILLGVGYGAFTYLKRPSHFPESTGPLEKAKQSFSQKATTAQPPSSVPAANPTENGDGFNSATPSTNNDQAVMGNASMATVGAALSSPPATATGSAPTESVASTEKVPGAEEDSLDANGDAQRTANVDAIKGPIDLDVKFVEAPNALVQQFLAEATENSGGDSGELNYAIVKNSSRWLRQRNFIELDHFTKKVPGVKKKVQWFSGAQHPESGSTFGLNFQVTIQDRVGGHIVGDIVISRTMIENHNGVPVTTRKDFTTRFETEVGSLIGLAGVMPHTNIPTDEKDWLQGSLLKIYLSPQFIENESELLILLNFKSDSK